MSPLDHDDACVRIRASEMLDLQLFRDSGAPEDVRESQRRRGADATLVDAVIAADALWREQSKAAAHTAEPKATADSRRSGDRGR